MATTNFVNGVTLTDDGWFNDVDASVYQGTFPSGVTALAFTGATTFTAFAGATTLLTLGGTGATAVVALPGTLQATGTTGALTVAGGAYVAKALNVAGLVTASAGATVASGQTLTLTGATVAGQPTWSSAQTIPGIVLSGNITESGARAITITGALSAGAISGTTGIFSSALASHQTSKIVVHQQDADTSRINAYGSSATAVGVLQFFQAATDGSPSFLHTFDINGKLTLAGALDAGAISGTTGIFGTGSLNYVLDVYAAGSTVVSSMTSDQTDAWLLLKASGTTLGHVRIGATAATLVAYAGNTTSATFSGTGVTIPGTLGVTGATTLNSASTRAVDGIRIGADSTNNLLDDASTGAGTATLYIGNASVNVTSDERVKENVRAWGGDASAILRALPVKAWDRYLSDAPMGGYDGGYVGFTAQDLRAAAPWAVNTQGNTGLPWQARYEFLNGVIVKGWQEHEARLRALEAKP